MQLNTFYLAFEGHISFCFCQKKYFLFTHFICKSTITHEWQKKKKLCGCCCDRHRKYTQKAF